MEWKLSEITVFFAVKRHKHLPEPLKRSNFT